jgi:hypothetical protein
VDATPEITQEFRDCEPLAAGMTFTLEHRGPAPEPEVRSAAPGMKVR